MIAHRDSIVAIKVRLGASLPRGQDLEVLGRARVASDESGVPLMLHLGGSSSPFADILEMLRRGDMVTHTLREPPNGVIDEQGRVRDAFVEARERGVWMDVAHGSGNFSWATAERAAAQGWWPDTISSDLHARNTAGPVRDLATTLSKFLLLGLSLEEVIARATAAPAKIYRFPAGCGTLPEGLKRTLRSSACRRSRSSSPIRGRRHGLEAWTGVGDDLPRWGARGARGIALRCHVFARSTRSA